YEAYSAKVNYGDEDQRLVFGTYGGKTLKFLGGARFPKTKGVFITKLDKNKVSWTKNIFYSQIFRNSSRNESNDVAEGSGSTTEILFHDVIESENGYIFIGESYYPTFHTEYTTDANGRTTSRQVFDGYVTDKCVVFSTDRKGTYKWSSTFYLPYYRTFNLGKKLVTVNANNDKLVLTCLKRGQISSYYIEDNGFKSDEEVSNVTSVKKGDKLRRANNNITLWYDNYYVAFGDVKISYKKKDENGKKSRNYLYIYKMLIGEELKNEEEEEK
ncbi:MAG: hypothetical protein HYZ42_12940, partial [Bacteroidetes bacterium]|nr:hypothetical protein [Bacteroidota bacterium]